MLPFWHASISGVVPARVDGGNDTTDRQARAETHQKRSWASNKCGSSKPQTQRAPFVFCAFTSAPRSSRSTATLLWPLEHAAWSGVEPSLDVLSTWQSQGEVDTSDQPRCYPLSASQRCQAALPCPRCLHSARARARRASVWVPRKYEAIAEQPLEVPFLLASSRPSTTSLWPQSAAW